MFLLLVSSSEVTQDQGVKPNTETPLSTLDKEKIDKENTIMQEEEVKEVFLLDKENVSKTDLEKKNIPNCN